MSQNKKGIRSFAQPLSAKMAVNLSAFVKHIPPTYMTDNLRFSQRTGLRPVQKLLQLDSMDDDLKNGLWNALHLYLWTTFGLTHRNELVGLAAAHAFMRCCWIHHFKLPIDTIPEYSDVALQKIHDLFFSCNWYEVYDFLDFALEYAPRKEDFRRYCNKVLEQENSAYRFVGNRLAPITSKEEIVAVETAASSPYSVVNTHLSTALSHLSNRTSPDYRNSIKESISAVESLTKIITENPKASLSDALAVLEQKGKLHGALKKGFSQLYGYTSDANGIRHALLEEADLTSTDARFMFIACSAFVNYILDKTK